MLDQIYGYKFDETLDAFPSYVLVKASIFLDAAQGAPDVRKFLGSVGWGAARRKDVLPKLKADLSAAIQSISEEDIEFAQSLLLPYGRIGFGVFHLDELSGFLLELQRNQAVMSLADGYCFSSLTKNCAQLEIWLD